MKRRLLFGCVPLAIMAMILFGLSAPTSGDPGDQPEKKYEDFEKVVKGAKVYEGLFRLYQKDDHLFGEIQPHQFDKPFLCPISIARGSSMAGHTLNFGDQWVLVFHKVGDKVHLVRRNVHFQAKKSQAVAVAVETTYTDSVLLALRIQSVHPARGSVLLNFNDIFMTDFAQIGRGGFDASRSTWHKIKTFPRNIELEVAATYTGMGRGDAVIDARGATIVVHYGLCEMPDGGYQPRLADDRVGYFLSVVKDFSSDNRDTSFVRYVNRWRLERAEPVDPKKPNKLSAPKKKIVFWIEKSVPEEYRAFVREGILEWNKAFEKIGFRDAIEVRQQENEDFEPEDVNYNTFRWVANDQGYAMGPSRSNPLTGEIFDADIIFDASMVRFYRNEAHLYGGSGVATMMDANPISPIRAARLGMGLEQIDLLGQGRGWDDRKEKEKDKGDDLARARWQAVQSGVCQCGPCLKRELNLAAMSIALRAGDDEKAAATATDELIGQAIKEVTMHEVGHTLGLRHNFKASTMLRNEDLHNTSITRSKGLVGSVMDYAPINLAPKGVKQGDYFTTTLGPYDYWAIEYAYKPLSGSTESEYEDLQKIASKSATPGHDYGTDEDLYSSSDPLINVWDLGSDPMKFGQDRILLAEELVKGLAEKASSKGEGYQRTRQGFAIALQQYGNGAHLVANFVGGVHYHRDHKGDPNGRDPFLPVKGDKQREALKFLEEHILSDSSFQFSPQLLRRLGADRWSHWGNGSAMAAMEFPVNERILSIQRVVLGHLLDRAVLERIQNNALTTDKEDKPLTVAEVFRSLTDGVWSDALVDGKDNKKTLASSVVRRNLQREYVKDVAAIVLGQSPVPSDARSLGRLHLRELNKKLDKLLNDKQLVLDDTTRAHLEESHERIAKVLASSLQGTD
jgi:Met-zincin/Domain of unknown function (DUF5117)/Domain of unknown function (DUF5118)